jgi:GNAT superfamily N-acetyltransferase
MSVEQVVVAPVPGSARPAAAVLAARAMRDNPMHVAALGSDAQRRVEVMRRAFEAMLAPGARDVLGAWLDGRLVGVAGFVASDHCQPRPAQLPGLMPALAAAGSRTPRMLRWLAAWGRRDPEHPHSHLGPVAVETSLQGRGLGSALLARYAELLDDSGQTGYLETDRLANVRLYERHGFDVVARAPVLGVRNWFMVRPRSTAADVR